MALGGLGLLGESALLASGLGTAFSGVSQTIGEVASRVVSFFRSLFNAVRNGLRRIISFFERITRSRFWDNIVRLVRWLSNPDNAITVITGLGLTLLGIAEMGVVLKEHAKDIENSIRELRSNVVKSTLTTAHDYMTSVLTYWSEQFSTIYNTFSKSLGPVIGTLVASASATISLLTSPEHAYRFILGIVLYIVGYVLDFFLSILQSLFPYLVQMFGYLAELSAYYGSFIVFYILIPMAMGLAVVRMYTRSLSLFTRIDQPVEIADRGFGWVMYNILYPMAILHPSVLETLEMIKARISTVPVPPRPVPPKPMYSEILLRLSEGENITIQLLSHGVPSYALSMALSEKENISISNVVGMVGTYSIPITLRETESIGTTLTSSVTYYSIPMSLDEKESISITNIASGVPHTVPIAMSGVESISIDIIVKTYLVRGILVGPIELKTMTLEQLVKTYGVLAGPVELVKMSLEQLTKTYGVMIGPITLTS